MKIENYLCDADGCKRYRVGRYRMFSHSCMDASGNGTERWHYAFDLCGPHSVIYADCLAELLFEGGQKPKNAKEFINSLGIVPELE